MTPIPLPLRPQNAPTSYRGPTDHRQDKLQRKKEVVAELIALSAVPGTKTEDGRQDSALH